MLPVLTRLMNATKSLRVASWLLGICLLPVFGYLLGANLFLRFGLPWAFKSTNTVNATVRGAWTIWPGVIHADQVRVVFQDQNLQWSLDLDQVRLRLGLRELLSKTLHATEVSGVGTVFRMRHRIEPVSKNAPWVSALPPIPEFPAPAVFEARVPEPPITDADYALWTVHLENVDVGVREIWVQFIRYQNDRGGGRARGAFRLRPARSLWVHPASLTLAPGRVTLGSEELAQSLSGKITCTVHEFDVRVPNGREVLRFISTELELRGQGVTPNPVLRAFPPDPELSLDAAPGFLTLSARVQRGKFSGDSSLRLESSRVVAEYRPFRLDARQVVALLASGSGERAEASLQFERAELASTTEQAEPARIRGAFAANVTSGLDAAGEVSEVERRVRLERVDVPDARLINALGGGVRFASGAIGFDLRASEQHGTLEGTTNVQVQRLRARGGRTEARLDGKLLATLYDARPNDGSGRLALDAELSPSRLDTSIGSKGESESAWSLTEAGRLRLNAELRRDTRGQVQSQFRLKSSKLTVSRGDSRTRTEVARVTELRLGGSLSRSAVGLFDAALTAHSRELRALAGNTWLRARSELLLTLSRFDPARTKGRLAAELVVDEGAAVSQGGSDCPWATFPKAHLNFGLDLSDARAFALLNASLTQARWTWGDFRAAGRADLSVRIDAPDWRRGLGRVAFVSRASGVTLKSGQNAPAGWEAKIPNLVLSGELHANTKVSGTLALSAPHAEARVGLTKMQTDFDAQTALRSVDFSRREAHFSGKFSLSHAGLSAGSERVEGWWADIHADSALLIARENMDLSVPFRANLRDGQPGLAILAAESSLPGFIVDAVPLRKIEVVGTLQRRCRLTNFRFTQASGGPLLGRGLLNSTSDSVHGAFLLRVDALQALSAGVELDSTGAGDSGVSLLAGDDWLRDRTQALDEVVKLKLEQPCTTPPAECSGEGDSN